MSSEIPRPDERRRTPEDAPRDAIPAAQSIGPAATTRELVELARRGDRAALEQLFDRAYPDLVRAAHVELGRPLRNRIDTLDLAQTVCREALKDLPRYDYRGKGSFHRWLLQILRNKIRNRLAFFRAKRRDMRRELPLDSARVTPCGPLSAPAPSPLEGLIDGEDRERLANALGGLSRPHREVIVNRYGLGLSWREIGARMGRSEEAAQMLCHRALSRLRAAF